MYRLSVYFDLQPGMALEWIWKAAIIVLAKRTDRFISEAMQQIAGLLPVSQISFAQQIFHMHIYRPLVGQRLSCIRFGRHVIRRSKLC